MSKQLTGAEMIAKERQEQIEKHGYTSYEDSQRYDGNDLLKAAMAVIDHDHCDWPWQNRSVYVHINDKPWVERLAIAGAFIAAEIDRLKYQP